uniref:LexA family protein n=1 Tax=Allisonella histaminiformans TaxID=209880 RepID=UPI0029422846
GYEEITPKMASLGEYFALRIQGHSMEPRIEDGEIVICQCQSDVDSGDVAIVLVNGDEATCKQIRKSPEGISLIGFNPIVYAPHFYSNKEIEELPVRIIGRVVESRKTW